MNYYDVFGLPPTASNEDISAAHKALAKQYHPDINSSKDAHEKMQLLNEANEVLSDSVRREEYNKKLGLNHQNKEQHIKTVKPFNPKSYTQNHSQQSTQQSSQRSTQNIYKKQPIDIKDTEERSERAAYQRRKAEEKLKKEGAAQVRRTERANKKAKETALKNKQVRVDLDRQHVLNVLSDIVMDGNTQRNNNVDIDEERHNATEVLLSLVRKDNVHLRRMAEEAERKQRIEDILTLVKEYNEEANPDRLV